LSSTTRLMLLAKERGWDKYEIFSIQFRHAARRAAEKEGNRRLGTVTVSRRSYDRWMAGGLKGTPRNEPATVLSYMFNMSVERLFGLVDDEAAAAHREPAAHSSAETGLGTAGPCDFGDPLEIIARSQALTSSNADPALLAMAETSIQGIVGRYETSGPQHLVGEVRLLREMLHTVLAGQQPPRTRAGLFRLAAQASGLLGYMAVNSSASSEVVDAYCREAEDLAGAVGDVDVQMWAAGTRSLGLYYQHRYSEADTAAQAGIELAPNSAQAIRLLVNGRARALARLGSRQGAEQAIGKALELSGRYPSLPDGLTPCISFAPYSTARTLANAVTARLSLGDVDEVMAYAAQIDDLIESSDSEWSRALVRLDVATALLQQDSPEVEHAMALGRSALRAGTTAPIRSVWQRANELYDLASRWHDEPAVGDYAEELRSWKTRPQARIVAGASCSGGKP
jgi:tetratricopeptide (TPR) repeat protein